MALLQLLEQNCFLFLWHCFITLCGILLVGGTILIYSEKLIQKIKQKFIWGYIILIGGPFIVAVAYVKLCFTCFLVGLVAKIFI